MYNYYLTSTKYRQVIQNLNLQANHQYPIIITECYKIWIFSSKN